MHASKGDHLVVDSRKVGCQPREGEIIEIQGQDGAPPYVVRWADGHEGVPLGLQVTLELLVGAVSLLVLLGRQVGPVGLGGGQQDQIAAHRSPAPSGWWAAGAASSP